MKNIDMSLKYGKVREKNAIFYVWVLLACFFLGCAVYFIVTGAMQAFWFFLLIGLLSLSLGLWFIIKNTIIRNKIKLWLKDAIPLEAQSYSVQHHLFSSDPRYRENVKLRIDFVYNNEHLVKESGTKTNNGYSPFYFKYCNRQINILYSPTYDEVMILKD